MNKDMDNKVMNVGLTKCVKAAG
ncbi:MAG: hypothetical protein H6Q55_348, partial [Deltaproteobacteria bacterium]|nr:hypothetical protein [Deltaproteobacteria bacterium]